MIGSLQRYHNLSTQLVVEGEAKTIPTQLVVVLTIVLQIATVIVLTLFLLS